MDENESDDEEKVKRDHVVILRDVNLFTETQLEELVNGVDFHDYSWKPAHLDDPAIIQNQEDGIWNVGVKGFRFKGQVVWRESHKICQVPVSDFFIRKKWLQAQGFLPDAYLTQEESRHLQWVRSEYPEDPARLAKGFTRVYEPRVRWIHPQKKITLVTSQFQYFGCTGYFSLTGPYQETREMLRALSRACLEVTNIQPYSNGLCWGDIPKEKYDTVWAEYETGQLVEYEEPEPVFNPQNCDFEDENSRRNFQKRQSRNQPLTMQLRSMIPK
jgi:hypothetical protein